MNAQTLTMLPFCVIAIRTAVLAIIKLVQRKRMEETYFAEGMGIGMCLGVFIMMALHGEIGIGISLGMLIGEAVGLFLEKEEKKWK